MSNSSEFLAVTGCLGTCALLAHLVFWLALVGGACFMVKYFFF